MKKTLNISILFIAILFNSCTNGQTASTLLSPDEFSNKISDTASTQIVDVRTPDEYTEGRIKDAKNINWNGDDFDTEIVKLDKDKPVYVYCYSGGRSSSAVSKMKKLGFKNIYELDGGIKSWRKAKLPETN